MLKKQRIQLAVVLVLILALTGAYFAIRAYNEKQEKKETDAQVTLTSFVADDVSEISYDADGVTWHFIKNADTGQWQNADDTDMELDADAFADFLKTAGSITGEPVPEGADESEYGLDAPERTVSVTTKNGTAALYFGTKNEILGKYYAKTEKSGVCLVEESAYTAFDRTAEDFAEAEDTAAEDTAE